MSSTPIDQIAHERHEEFEDAFRRAAVDRILTDTEMLELGAAWAEVAAANNELCGTVSHIRRVSHASLSSVWVDRKANEHVRDMAGVKTNDPDSRQRVEALAR
jgi:hypothetical protein